MKKFLALFLALVLCVSLCSCDLSFLMKGKETEESGKPPVETENVEEDTTFEPGKAVNAGDLEVKFISVRFAEEVVPENNSGFYVTYKAAEGKTYLVGEAEVKNNGSSAVTCDKVGTLSATLDKVTYSAFIIAKDEKGSFAYANITEIPSGKSVKVKWLIEVPKGKEESAWAMSFVSGEKTYTYTHNKVTE